MGNNNSDLDNVLLYFWFNSSSISHFIYNETGPEILSTLLKITQQIKAEIGRFLKEKLNLIMSEEKTLITNAGSQAAKFLGYEIKYTLQKEKIDKLDYIKILNFM